MEKLQCLPRQFVALLIFIFIIPSIYADVLGQAGFGKIQVSLNPGKAANEWNGF